MNKKETIIPVSLFVSIFLLALTISFVSSYSNDNSSIQVSVNVTQPFVKIQVTPNQVSLGETTLGYNSDISNITFINKGTLDTTITPVLDNGADPLFNYLEFNTASCSTTTSSGWHNITYYNSNSLFGVLSKSSTYNGDGEQDSACIRLGLDSYNGPELNSDLSLSTKIIFWAMPA